VRKLPRVANPTMTLALIGAAVTVVVWVYSCVAPQPLFRPDGNLDRRAVVLNDGRAYVRLSRDSGDVVAVRFSALTAPWLLLFAWGVRRKLRHLKPHLRRARGECPACGYDLRATPGRCPECGAVTAAGGDDPLPR
jgi:hypothetical protein